MGFWIFMLINALLIPLTMIGIGGLFLKKAPKKINYVFGYRTGRSMKNMETWRFAHRYLGKLWLILGLVLLPPSVAVMAAVAGNGTDTVGTVGGILMIVQAVPMLGAILPTERALAKKFDENGRPR